MSDKKTFHSSLNKENITDANHKHAKTVWEYFEIKNIGEYHDLYAQNEGLTLAITTIVYKTTQQY